MPRSYSAPKRPNLAVIDEAIRLIEFRITDLSCIALKRAEVKVTKNDAIWLFESEYVKQYTEFVCGPDGQHRPNWWNGSLLGKAQRLKALRAFRKACVNAGLKVKK